MATVCDQGTVRLCNNFMGLEFSQPTALVQSSFVIVLLYSLACYTFEKYSDCLVLRIDHIFSKAISDII